HRVSSSRRQREAAVDGCSPPEAAACVGRTGGGNRAAASEAAVRPPIKSKGGAPRGNRNAHTSGSHTATFREFKRSFAGYLRALRAELALLNAALPSRPKRVICLIETPTRCYVRTLRGRYPKAV